MAQARRADAKDQKLLAVIEIAKTVATQHDVEVMVAGSLRGLVETLSVADVGALLLYNPTSEVLEVKASQGYERAAIQRIRLAPGEAISGKVFQSGQACLCATPREVAEAMGNLTPANREFFRAATAGLRQPRSAVCVPLATARARLGVLVLENMRGPGRFGQRDLVFLQHVADVIALAIENVRLREELQATQAAAEANQLKAGLIATLAHEMRTPLTSIKGYASALLMEEASFDQQTQREFLEIIDEECDLLQGLIHDLLESSIIDAGLLRIEPQPVLLQRLLRDVVAEMEHHTNAHRFLVHVPPDLPIVEADPDRVAQVLRNLLDNAVKYSPDGGLIVVRAEAAGDEVVISVADQGVGIAPEHLNRLFEKYFRVRTGPQRHVVGSGLGLPIARTIVESHCGRIWAESRVGEGTTLWFTLPVEGPTRTDAGQGGRNDAG